MGIKPMVGLEPTTSALRKPCSTVELHRRGPRDPIAETSLGIFRFGLKRLAAASRNPATACVIGRARVRRHGNSYRSCEKSRSIGAVDAVPAVQARKKIPKKICRERFLVDGITIARYNRVRLMEQAITRRPPPSLRPEHPGRRSLLRSFFARVSYPAGSRPVYRAPPALAAID